MKDRNIMTRDIVEKTGRPWPTVRAAIYRLRKRGVFKTENPGRGEREYFTPEEVKLIIAEMKDGPGKPPAS